ncbi:hypothetical protein EDD34_0086 [Myceligenerans xiligouense]|uniref:Uncharacterized protein n=1 Tax=Myceligenerans xiligouense TaxID=253184 RepID=A0A3N4YJF0_9MICO|nr:hypothetical protein EDD34_0086 [Myceligenerans xiligouense]
MVDGALDGIASVVLLSLVGRAGTDRSGIDRLHSDGRGARPSCRTTGGCRRPLRGGNSLRHAVPGHAVLRRVLDEAHGDARIVPMRGNGDGTRAAARVVPGDAYGEVRRGRDNNRHERNTRQVP